MRVKEFLMKFLVKRILFSGHESVIANLVLLSVLVW